MRELVFKEEDNAIAFQRFNMLYEFMRWNGDTHGIQWSYTATSAPYHEFFATFHRANEIEMGVREKAADGFYHTIHVVRFDLPYEWNSWWKDGSRESSIDEKQFTGDFFEFMEDYAEVQTT